MLTYVLKQKARSIHSGSEIEGFLSSNIGGGRASWAIMNALSMLAHLRYSAGLSSLHVLRNVEKGAVPLADYGRYPYYGCTNWPMIGPRSRPESIRADS